MTELDNYLLQYFIKSDKTLTNFPKDTLLPSLGSVQSQGQPEVGSPMGSPQMPPMPQGLPGVGAPMEPQEAQQMPQMPQMPNSNMPPDFLNVLKATLQPSLENDMQVEKDKMAPQPMQDDPLLNSLLPLMQGSTPQTEQPAIQGTEPEITSGYYSEDNQYDDTAPESTIDSSAIAPEHLDSQASSPEMGAEEPPVEDIAMGGDISKMEMALRKMKVNALESDIQLQEMTQRNRDVLLSNPNLKLSGLPNMYLDKSVSPLSPGEKESWGKRIQLRYDMNFQFSRFMDIAEDMTTAEMYLETHWQTTPEGGELTALGTELLFTLKAAERYNLGTRMEPGEERRASDVIPNPSTWNILQLSYILDKIKIGWAIQESHFNSATQARGIIDFRINPTYKELRSLDMRYDPVLDKSGNRSIQGVYAVKVHPAEAKGKRTPTYVPLKWFRAQPKEKQDRLIFDGRL